MLMVYKVVILHEFGKVQGLIDLLLRTKVFLVRSVRLLAPFRESLAVARTKPFQGFS